MHKKDVLLIIQEITTLQVEKKKFPPIKMTSEQLTYSSGQTIQG